MQRLNHTDQEAVRMTYGIYEICALAEPVLEDYLEILYGNANQTDAVCNANLDKNERLLIPWILRIIRERIIQMLGRRGI